MRYSRSLAYLICCVGAMGQGPPAPDAGLRQAVERTVYALKDSGHGAWLGENKAQRLTLEFDSDKAVMSHPDGRIGFHLSCYGYGGRLGKPVPATLSAIGNRLEYRRGELTEWYVNGASGLEQGFSFARRPAGAQAGEPLIIALGVTGDLSLKRQDGAVLLAAGNEVVPRYSGLTATAWVKLKGFPASARQSGLKSAFTPTLKEFRSRKSPEPPYTPEAPATERQITNLVDVLATVDDTRLAFLYRQRWDTCELTSDGLPRISDVQYLEATLRLMHDRKNAAEEARAKAEKD